MLTDRYLDLIPHGNTSLAGLFLAMEDAHDHYCENPNYISASYLESREDEWFDVCRERCEVQGFHVLAFAKVRIPVDPTEAEAYLAAERYSERIRRD